MNVLSTSLFNQIKIMKKSAIICLQLFLTASIFSQQNELSRRDYLDKSENQKKTAKIILGAGGLVAITGFILTINETGDILDPDSKDNSKLANTLGYTGLGIMAVSVPFFIASGKNRRMAMKVSLIRQGIPQTRGSNFATVNIPAIKLSISFNRP
jgi:hypothetical protein